MKQEKKSQIRSNQGLGSGRKKSLLKTLPVESYKELVDNLAFYKPCFYVTGGEPFLYLRFVELLNYAKEKGCNVDVVTNDVKLKQYAEEIVRIQWDMIILSFDGPEEILDLCRRTRGAHITAVDCLLEVQKWRKTALAEISPIYWLQQPSLWQTLHA